MLAVFLVGLLAMAALAVDLGMAFAARAEAQRAADSAALAGGSAFLDYLAHEAEPHARDRAYEYALMQTIQGVDVDSSEVTVQVIPDSMKVRVWINRDGLDTWFAKVLGIDFIDVGAMAAARASGADEATCVKPWAIPDIWDEPNVYGDDNNPEDPDNETWDEGEEWVWGDDDGDGDGVGDEYYERWDPESPGNDDATGYGSDHRDPTSPEGRIADYGLKLKIKVTDPQAAEQINSGQFFPWRMPEDETRLNCAGTRGVGGTTGASVYEANICNCNTNDIVLATGEPGDEDVIGYDTENGNMVGPTFSAVSDLLSADPGAYWDDDYNNVLGCNDCPALGTEGYNPYEDKSWLQSPRVIKVALFDPAEATKSGLINIKFNNIAMVFLERQDTRHDPVEARFLYFAAGSGAGDEYVGSTVLYLRLVE
jgi:hypothetical protein